MKSKKIILSLTAVTVFFIGNQIKAQSTIASNTLSGVSPNPTQYLGSAPSNAFDVIFKANGTERMRLLQSNGNVGIGTILPQRKLVVSNGGSEGMELNPFANYTQIISYNRSKAQYIPLVLQDAAGGNVGIGTTTPTTKLQINNGVLNVTGTNSWGGSMAVFGPSSATDLNAWGIENIAGAAGGLNFWRPWNGQPNAGNNFLYLKHSNGNVGINTNNPTAKLTVNGNVLIGDPATVTLPAGYKMYVQTGILTEKVKVSVVNTTDWSDYVFAEGYKLKSITDLEAFVKANKHLPNVPSAQEVVNDGIDIAKMDAKLLEKIEELALYIIELKKENTALLNRVEKIENK